MFFEDEKEIFDDIENLDDIDLDLEDAADDESISWDELLKDSSADLGIVSVASDKGASSNEKSVKTKSKENVSKTKKNTQKEEIQDIGVDDVEDEAVNTPKKDAFEVFGGKDNDENIAEVDNVMDDESQSILNELDSMEVTEGLNEDEDLNIGIKPEEKSTNIPVIAGAIFATVLVLGSLLFMFMGPKKTDVNVVQNNVTQEQAQQNQTENSQSETGADEQQIPVVDDNSAKDLKADKKVVVSVESAGRVNPFLPTFDDFNNNYYAGIPSQILMPPDKYGNEPDAQELLRVSVSGILFDNIKPSAIITINGIDYFVQKGDMVDDYLVMDINRQFVIIKKGTNVYKAGVGERFSQNPEISGAAVYGAGGIRRYKSVSEDYTSASDVEVRAIEDN